MGKLSRVSVFGLLWLAFAAAAFGADGKAPHSFAEPAIFGLTGIGLILLGLARRRRKR